MLLQPQGPMLAVSLGTASDGGYRRADETFWLVHTCDGWRPSPGRRVLQDHGSGHAACTMRGSLDPCQGRERNEPHRTRRSAADKVFPPGRAGTFLGADGSPEPRRLRRADRVQRSARGRLGRVRLGPGSADVAFDLEMGQPVLSQDGRYQLWSPSSTITLGSTTERIWWRRSAATLRYRIPFAETSPGRQRRTRGEHGHDDQRSSGNYPGSRGDTQRTAAAVSATRSKRSRMRLSRKT